MVAEGLGIAQYCLGGAAGTIAGPFLMFVEGLGGAVSNIGGRTLAPSEYPLIERLCILDTNWS